MERLKRLIIITSVSFLVLCLVLSAFFWLMLEPKAEWKFIPYDFIMWCNAYEHISYDSTEYFFMDVEDRRKDIEYNHISDEEIEVTVVDINGNAFDDRRTEPARVYEGDTDREFIIFDGEIYTKNKDMAAYWYKEKRHLE